MKKIYLLAVLLLCGCKSVGLSDLNVAYEPVENPINKITPMVSVDNVENAYQRWKGMGVTKSAPPYGAFEDANNISSKNFRADDVINVFRNEIKENISSQSGTPKGKIYLSIEERRASGSFWGVLSALGAKIPVLLGMPSNKVTENLSIKVEIINNAGDSVKTYRQSVENSEYIAMYYGYGSKNAYRKVALENMKEALSLVREQIAADAKAINSKLK